MKVLLGVCDKIIRADATVTYDVNKIGGYPNSIGRPFRCPQCVVCAKDMLLATQIYCPLEGSNFHRTLYVFSCVSRKCWNEQHSIRVFRSQTSVEHQTESGVVSDDDVSGSHTDSWYDEPNEWECTDNADNATCLSKESSETGNGWCEDADEWGDHKDIENEAPPGEIVNNQQTSSCSASHEDKIVAADEMMRKLNVHCEPSSEQTPQADSSVVIGEDDLLLTQENVQSMLDTLNVNVPTEGAEVLKETQASSSQSGICLESHYLNVFEESTTSVMEHDNHVSDLLQDYTQREGMDWSDSKTPGSKNATSGGELYEKDDLKHGDKIFHKFHKRLSHCPQQVIRYEWNGFPLLMAPLTQVQTDQPLSVCSYCQSERVFELQLMPALLQYLKLPDYSEAMTEFGTVMVFTCKKSCWSESDTYREEAVYVQPDPDQHLFKK